MYEKSVETPGRRAFYKYTTPDTAIAVLRTKTVRYSSPQSFNDPFDIQSGLHFEFDLDSLHSRVLDRIQELASGEDAPQVDANDVWGQLILVAHQKYPTHGFPRDKWRDMTEPSFRNLVEVIKKTQSDYQKHWREVLLPGLRVFCVTEDRDNLLMWAHYALDHQGVVFEYWSLPDEDNPLSVARPVRYAKKPPPFFTEQEWLDDLVGRSKLDFQSLYRNYAYVKSDHWAYEREWRVWYPLADAAKEYDTMPIRASELKAIYLGCRMQQSTTKLEVLRLLSKSFPSARAFQAHKVDSAYELAYTEI